MPAMPIHRLPLIAIVLIAAAALSTPGKSAADITIDGDRMTVRTNTVSITFRGPDIVGLTNRLTKEQYVRGIGPVKSMIDMSMMDGSGTKLDFKGWTQGKNLNSNPNAAMASISDLTRTIWISVIEDAETQDVTMTVWGTATREGVTGITWGLRGLDFGDGRLILPAAGGRCADALSTPPSISFDYPTSWEAQLAIWQGKMGGFVVYSRDDKANFKTIKLNRRGNFLDLGFETQAVAPFGKAGSVPMIEWRLNAYRGVWRVPALGYRNVMHFYRPPVPSAGKRAWVKDVRIVVSILSDKFETTLLDELATKVDPKKTLLYLPTWRRDGYDVNYPDYTPLDGVKPFTDYARQLGFHVMLHTDLPGVTPTNPDYEKVKQWQIKDAKTGALMGWYWDHPENDKNRFAFINPASITFRNLFIERIRPVMEEIHPDAIHLDVSGPTWNDGNGLIDGLNYAQGSVALHRALLTAFPDLVLGGESMNELIAPYNWYAQRWYSGTLSTHPISDFLFGDHVVAYGYLGQPNPDQAPVKFLNYFAQYEGQGVRPTPVVFSPEDLGPDRPGMHRVLAQVKAWQDHNMEPDWNDDWKGAIYRWKGTDGVKAVVAQDGPSTSLKVGDVVLYRRAKGASQIATTGIINGWPAYDDKAIYGLDPTKSYWLDDAARPVGTTHISYLSKNTRLAGAQITPSFCAFSLDAIEEPTDDLMRVLSAARPGITIEGHDLPMGQGGTAQQEDVTVNGETRTSLFEHPPYQNKTGESFLEYSLLLPTAPKATFAFDYGISDGGNRTDGVTFRLTIDGKEIWSQNTAAHIWTHGRADLTMWSGKEIHMRLITGPGPKNDPSYDHAAWSEMRILANSDNLATNASVALAAGDKPLTIVAAKQPAIDSSTGLKWEALPLPANVVIILKPGVAVQNTVNLLDLPFDQSISTNGLAKQGSVYGSGTIAAASCGGVAKTRGLNAHTPDGGHTLFSWILKLPDRAGKSLSFSAGLGDNAKSTGVGFVVRINGEEQWSWNTVESRWNDGSVGLDKWRGQTILLQLVTDSLGDNEFDWAKWADIQVK